MHVSLQQNTLTENHFIVKMSGNLLIDTTLMRRYNARRHWTVLRSVVTMISLHKPSLIKSGGELEFENIVIRHIKKNRLKKCFRRKKSLK